ncbi:MAG: hypothetical protein AAGH15_12065 [Myxococcota bacterium]
MIRSFGLALGGVGLGAMALSLACDFSSDAPPPARPAPVGASTQTVVAPPAPAKAEAGSRFRRRRGRQTTPGPAAGPYTYTERVGEEAPPPGEAPGDTEAMLRAAAGDPTSCGALGDPGRKTLGLTAHVTANGIVSRSRVSGPIPAATRTCLERRIAAHRFGAMPAGVLTAELTLVGTAGEVTETEVAPPPPNSGSGAIVGISNAGQVVAPPAPSENEISNSGTILAPPAPSGTEISNSGGVEIRGSGGVAIGN